MSDLRPRSKDFNAAMQKRNMLERELHKAGLSLHSLEKLWMFLVDDIDSLTDALADMRTQRDRLAGVLHERGMPESEIRLRAAGFTPAD